MCCKKNLQGRLDTILRVLCGTFLWNFHPSWERKGEYSAHKNRNRQEYPHVSAVHQTNNKSVPFTLVESRLFPLAE